MTMAGEGVAFYCPDPLRLDHAHKFAENLDLQVFTKPPRASEFPLLLNIKDDRLVLQENPELGKSFIFVDFSEGALDFKRRFGGALQLVKAVGGAQQKILDVTAGLCRDAFILASHQCEVHALERSRVVAALVIDGIRRAKMDERLEDILKRFKFEVRDGVKVLGEIKADEYDVIFLDPMFAEKKRKSLPKKEMQILARLLKPSADESESQKLLKLARTKAQRVVVKRPAQADPLAPDVSVTFKGTSTRFDVYTRT